MPDTRAKHWVFTKNNYSDADQQHLRSVVTVAPDFEYLVFGREQGDNGTPHLQGYVSFSTRKRFTQVTAILPRGTHIEGARGNPRQASHYCKKDGDFEEFGTLPVGQGKRTDFERFAEFVRAFYLEHGHRPHESVIAVEFPSLFARYRTNLNALSGYLCPPTVLTSGDLKPWQQSLYDELHGAPDDRKVLFYVDYEGGTGKSFFIRYALSKKPNDVQMLSVGKRDDLAFAVDVSKRWFLFNVPRGGMEHLRYEILEQLKDRMVFSPKYESSTKLLEHNCHVVVFCNEDPEPGKMSDDRYVIRKNFI